MTLSQAGFNFVKTPIHCLSKTLFLVVSKSYSERKTAMIDKLSDKNIDCRSGREP